MSKDVWKQYVQIVSDHPERLQKVMQEGGDSREGQIEAMVKDAAKDGIELTAADFDVAVQEPAPVANALCNCFTGGGGTVDDKVVCACLAAGIGIVGNKERCACVAFGHGK